MRYLQVRFAAYHRAELDAGALSSVARGSAAEQVRSYVESLQQQGHHTVGDVWVDIASVGMKGPSATLTSCLHNASADADRHNRVVERELPPAYDVRATAVRGPRATWLIDTIRFDGRPRCGPG